MVYVPTWLGYIDGKCYHIYHTWILWVVYPLVFTPTHCVSLGGRGLSEAAISLLPVFQRPAAHRPEGRSFCFQSCYCWFVLKPPYFYILCRCSIFYYLILFNIIYIYSYTVYIYIMFLPKWCVVLHSQTTMFLFPSQNTPHSSPSRTTSCMIWRWRWPGPSIAWVGRSVCWWKPCRSWRTKARLLLFFWGRGRLEMGNWTPNSMCVYYIIYIILYIYI